MSNTCSKCGGRIERRRGRHGFYTAHPESSNGRCPAGPAQSARRRSPEEQAEYRMGADGFTAYRDEVMGHHDYGD